jgi:hypothetical protein
VLTSLAVWFRVSSSSRVAEPYSGAPGPAVSQLKAETIAVDEVKKRDGWSGKADRPDGEGNRWYVNVWREPLSADNTRTVVVDTEDGHIIDYHPTPPFVWEDRLRASTKTGAQ